jgi:hypothetical protein
MKNPDAGQGQSASEIISKKITELGDWRGETLKGAHYGWSKFIGNLERVVGGLDRR